MKRNPESKGVTSNRNMFFVGIGLELLILVVVGWWIGGLVDVKMGSGQVFTATMIIVAFFVWLTHLILLLKRLER